MHFACKYFAFGLKTNADTFLLSGFFSHAIHFNSCGCCVFSRMIRWHSLGNLMNFVVALSRFCMSLCERCVYFAYIQSVYFQVHKIYHCMLFFSPRRYSANVPSVFAKCLSMNYPGNGRTGMSEKKKPATKKSILSLSSVAQLLGKLFFVWESAQPPKYVCIVPVNIFPFTIFISASLPKPELNEFQCLDRMFGATRVMRGCIGASHFSKL